MKKTLQQAAQRVPLLRSVLARRGVLRVRLLALLRPLRERPAARLDTLRRDLGRLLRIEPVFAASDRAAFDAHAPAHHARVRERDAQILRAHWSGAFRLRRFCLCCNETTDMLVDHEAAFEGPGGQPNWRERLVCGACAMNNRQRLVAKLVQQAVQEYARPRVYLMEQVTPIFEWVRRLPGTEVHGSEYLGHQYRGGEQVHGVRHEDVMNLSYPDASFDLIVSNDVMEHIPDPGRALRECFRVLRPGGTVLATFPFRAGTDTTVQRARLAGDTIEHLLPPQYHGNPVSSDGSLVFHDFGWDLLDDMHAAGFDPAVCEVYSSDEFGHLGTGLLVFRLRRPPAATPA